MTTDAKQKIPAVLFPMFIIGFKAVLMNKLNQYLLPALLISCLSLAGCDQPADSIKTLEKYLLEETGLKSVDPAKALEKYLREESGLKDTGWGFYAAQSTPSGVKAYLLWPPSGGAQVFPDEIEVMRLCPDNNLHSFWRETQLKSIELLVVRKIDLNTGKAKLMRQVTCTNDFDLIAHQKSIRESELTQDKEETETPNTPSTQNPDKLYLSNILKTEFLEIGTDGRGYIKVEKDYENNRMTLYVLQNDKTTPNPPYYPPRVDTTFGSSNITSTPGSDTHIFVVEDERLGRLINKVIHVSYRVSVGVTTYAVDLKDRFYSPLGLKDMVSQGNTRQLDKILDRRPELIKFTDINGQTPLHWASNENSAIMNYLIKRGANINAQSNDGSTAMHFLVRRASHLGVESLMAHNPDLSLTTTAGKTAIDEAKETNNRLVIGLLPDTK